ncbi:MAG: hypothetical protein ACHP93_04140 [Solirubrobacterales bacterium]
MHLARPITAGAVGGLLVLAGCGGSSGPSKAQYVAKADAICTTAHTQTAPLIQQVTAAGASLASGGAPSARRLATVVRRLHDVAASGLARLRALRQPSGDHAAIERFLAPLASVVDAIGQAATALGSGQAPQALGLLQQVQPVAQQVTSAAQTYGLQQCGSVLSALG